MTSERTRQRLVARLQQQGITDDRVLRVIESTPRHIFLDEALAHRAYEDASLPIGFGQTLSRPYIVARMTELLLRSVHNLDSVLEIGTGSGYQSAILAQIFERVWSVERIRPLQEKARSRLRLLRLSNVVYEHADGGLGWPEDKQFPAILSAAAPEVIPRSLKAQLAPNGVMVLPVGGQTQTLWIVKRLGDSQEFEETEIEPVNFVPLVTGTKR